jgi:hypothetical protein
MLIFFSAFWSFQSGGASLCPKIKVLKNTSDRCQENKIPSFVHFSKNLSDKQYTDAANEVGHLSSYIESF